MMEPSSAAIIVISGRGVQRSSKDCNPRFLRCAGGPGPRRAPAGVVKMGEVPQSPAAGGMAMMSEAPEMLNQLLELAKQQRCAVMPVTSVTTVYSSNTSAELLERDPRQPLSWDPPKESFVRCRGSLPRSV